MVGARFFEERGRGAAPGSAGRPRMAASVAALLIAALAVAGCGAGDGSGSKAAEHGAAAPGAVEREAGSVREDAAADGEAGREGAGAGEASAGALPDPAATHIIRTASLTVAARDVPGALAEARAAVEAAGGYVADESTDRDSEGRDRSRVTLRVPPQEYDGLVERLSGLGRLVERKVSAQDVTDQVVDVESRIATRKASVERVRKLMDEATALSDVVSLEAELSDRQADLEALQARLKSLRERTGTATVTLSLHEPDAEPVEGGGVPSFGDALADGWDAFLTVLRWIAVALGAALPFAAAGLLAAVLWRRVRSRLPRRAAGAGGAAVPVPAPPAASPAAGSPAGPGDGGPDGGSDGGKE